MCSAGNSFIGAGGGCMRNLESKKKKKSKDKAKRKRVKDSSDESDKGSADDEIGKEEVCIYDCLLYTSDAADD